MYKEPCDLFVSAGVEGYEGHQSKGLDRHLEVMSGLMQLLKPNPRVTIY